VLNRTVPEVAVAVAMAVAVPWVEALMLVALPQE